jgi:hypothetical protein
MLMENHNAYFLCDCIFIVGLLSRETAKQPNSKKPKNDKSQNSRRLFGLMQNYLPSAT